MTDSISQFISIIKNGYLARKKQVVVPYSNFKNEIAKVLTEEGFLQKVEVREVAKKKDLILTLKYLGKKPAINEIKIISKPGLRVYQKVKESKKILGGLGRRIMTTSAGVMSGQKAWKKKLGGEIILEVY